jgi:hypothetical protein
MKGFYADDGFPLYHTISDTCSAASAFVSFISRNGMAMHTEGDKAATFMLIGSWPVSDQTDQLSFSNMDDGTLVTCDRAFRIKQLGLTWCVNDSGRYTVDLSPLISRLKHAHGAMFSIAKYTMSSTAIHIVKTYIVSVISYAIVIWFPLAFKYSPKSLNELRYWYASIMCYVAMDSKDMLGWCNKSKSMEWDCSIMDKLRLLTGLPKILEIYHASARSHYEQVSTMVELGWLNGIVRIGNRIKGDCKLRYVRANNVLNWRFSPLYCLLLTVNSTGRSKLKFPAKYSWLVCLEKHLEGRSDARKLQKIFTLVSFGKIEDQQKRKRLTD